MINKKALIVTFHCCPNYGAILQTYGLYQFLKNIFKEVEVLNYQPKSLMDEYKNINTYSLNSIVASVWALPSFLRKKKRFSKFIQRINLSSSLYSDSNQIENTSAQYCFVGSDQIWNPEITKGFDKVYFGKIAHKKTYKVISYAASFGKSEFTNNELKLLKSLLSGVDVVSVREEGAKRLLDTRLNIQSQVVLDPTLLAGCACFRPFVHNVSNAGDYLFVYTLDQKPETVIRPLARKIANRQNLKIIEINGNRKALRLVEHQVIYDAGPIEFLTYLANAKYVVTDSFHGTAFSLLFHRNFITVPHKTRGSRMISLLSMVNLLNRVCSDSFDVDLDSPIDWLAVDKSLSVAREQSESFIIRAVNDYDSKA